MQDLTQADALRAALADKPAARLQARCQPASGDKLVLIRPDGEIKDLLACLEGVHQLWGLEAGRVLPQAKRLLKPLRIKIHWLGAAEKDVGADGALLACVTPETLTEVLSIALQRDAKGFALLGEVYARD